MELHHDTLIQRNKNNIRIKMYKIRNPLCVIEAKVHEEVRLEQWLLEIEALSHDIFWFLNISMSIMLGDKHIGSFF